MSRKLGLHLAKIFENLYTLTVFTASVLKYKQFFESHEKIELFAWTRGERWERCGSPGIIELPGGSLQILDIESC